MVKIRRTNNYFLSVVKNKLENMDCITFYMFQKQNIWGLISNNYFLQTTTCWLLVKIDIKQAVKFEKCRFIEAEITRMCGNLFPISRLHFNIFKGFLCIAYLKFV